MDSKAGLDVLGKRRILSSSWDSMLDHLARNLVAIMTVLLQHQLKLKMDIVIKHHELELTVC